MNREHSYHLIDIENPNKLVKQTLKNFGEDNPPSEQWLSMLLLSSDYRDDHEAFNHLEKLFKQVITSQLNKARLVAQLPTHDDILINNDGYRDRYLSSELLETVIQTEIGSRRKPEYQAVKIWSTLYHKYFVTHDLNDKRFAEHSHRTSRQIRNYKRQGIKLLILHLTTLEKTIIEINQQQYQLKPQTYFEYEAESLIRLAQSARSLHGEQLALQKCEEAMQYAYDNRLPRYLVKAAALKVFTLLQGGIEDVQKAGGVLGDVEHSNIIKTVHAGPQKAWMMAKIYGMWAHIWRRGGNLDIAIESVNQAMTWLNTLHGVDIELSKDTYFIRSVMYWSSGAYRQAESDLLHILDLQPQHTYDVYEMLGLVNWSMSQFTKAEDYFCLAIEKARKRQDRWHLSLGQGNLGLIYLSQFQLKKSQYYIELHQSNAKKLGSVKELNRATANLGIVHLHQQKYDLAIILLERSRHLYDQMSASESQVVVYTNLSQAHTLIGDHPKALSLAERALEITESIVGAYPPRLIALRCLAECELLEIEQRVDYLQSALALTQEYRVFDKAACLLGLSWLHSSADKRISFAEEGTQLLHDIGAQRWLKKIRYGYPHLPLLI